MNEEANIEEESCPSDSVQSATSSLRSRLASREATRVVDLGSPIDTLETRETSGTGGRLLTLESTDQAVSPGIVRALLAAAGIGVVCRWSAPRTATRARSSKHPLADDLTERQEEVLRLIVRRLSNKEIAQELDIALSTVKTHVRNILRVFDVASRQQLHRRFDDAAEG